MIEEQQDTNKTDETEVNPATIATVRGQPITELPKDLYIPPDALEVFLESFAGPLDLLLYLIKKQNLDILDIPIAAITVQYMQYVEMMKLINLELAAEYLLMAGMLAEIKSRMLLPRTHDRDSEEDDPRAELVRRLQEYERFKQAAENLDNLPRINREIFLADVEPPTIEKTVPEPQVDLKDLWFALRDVMERAQMYADHHVQKEVLSTRERMSHILLRLTSTKFSDFADLFDIKEGKLGVVVTFSAILELLRQSMIEIVQHEPYANIHLRKVQ